MAYERALIALLLLATFAGAGDCCGWRAVPILPEEWRSGGGNNTYYNNYTTYNVTSTTYNNYTNYSITTVNYSDYWWYVSGTWLVNNRTAATSGVNVSGVNGNTYLTGNNINFDRVGPNYIQATDGSGSLYFGSGGTTGVIGLLNSALANSLLVNGNGVGVYTTADEFEFSVAGAAYASENVSTPLVNTSCIVLADERVCSWGAVNGSMGGGSERYNGTFNETEGTFVYNSTPYRVDFNETLLNETIESYLLSTTYYPNATVTLGGTNTTGNITLLWWYDGLTYNVTEGGGGTPVLDLYVNFTGVADFSQWVTREYYLGSASHHIAFEIYDYDSASWEGYYEIVGQGGFTIITVPIFDASEHISGGVVQTRYRHIESGIASHELFVDFAWLVDGGTIGASTNLAGYAEYNFGFNNFNGSGNFNTTGALSTSGLAHTGNITNPVNASWGYYNNGTCIVIGNLYYVSEC